MNIPGLGEMSPFELHQRTEWRSAPMPLRLLRGALGRIAVVDYEKDVAKADFHRAIANLLGSGPELLEAVEGDIFAYYQDCNANWQPDETPYVALSSPNEVWSHVELGNQLIASRRPKNGVIYFSLESNCDWEPESGLEIVFENGLRVNKIGPHDGALTHSDAADDERLESIVYPRA
jgi:hypothetical protein